ncbi:MAG: RluA family pseudouridine synthase [Rubrivivax sp.]
MGWLLHVDEDLVLVDKPAGLLSVPGRGADKADCAWARVRAEFPDALVVHRLDMATSGLLLFARGLPAQRALSAAFEQRRVHKSYVALVQGEPASDQGRIELPLAADWPRRPLQKVDALRGRPALTHWRVLAREGALTRVAFEPVTGRSHQLRVHAAAMGWPIAGDALYGNAASSPRLLLHASELALTHPRSGLPHTWRSAAPF